MKTYYQKLISLLNKNKDKVYHYLGGNIIYCVAYPFLKEWSIILVIVAAFLKELWDLQGNGTVELADFFVTVLGGIIPFLLIK